MADVIQLLPDHVANQIAAGEVVQRPASVVKELLENAIDAGATEVKLLLKDAGKTHIQVIDNGSGMSVTDARLCFERHATSKIREAADLFQLQTKGFRGEALASIAAVAHVSLTTKNAQDELANSIRIEGSEIKAQEPTSAPQGTSIAVKNLFFNIPARRNFLKSNQVELRHCLDEFHRVAMVHPQVAFSMYHNGTELFHLPPSNLRQRIVGIFGSKTNEKLVPISEDTEILKLSGFVQKPQFAKKSRGAQFFFVNNRFIKHPYLHHAVVTAFDGLMPSGIHPGYFLFMEVPPETIDVNIHPTKTEVKFEDEHALFAIIRSAVKHALGQFNIAPVLDFENGTKFDTSYNQLKQIPKPPSVSVDRDFNPFQSPKNSSKAVDWTELYEGLQVNPEAFENEATAESLFSGENDINQKGITFQWQQKYIVSSITSGLVFINQNRAHQRVLYEQFLVQLTGQQAVGQTLLFPLVLSFEPQHVQELLQTRATLEHLGFQFGVFEGETIELTAIHSQLKESDVPLLIETLIDQLIEKESAEGFGINDQLARTLARCAALPNGTSLDAIAQEQLVNDLFACKEASYSPSGKKVFTIIHTDEIDKKIQ